MPVRRVDQLQDTWHAAGRYSRTLDKRSQALVDEMFPPPPVRRTGDDMAQRILDAIGDDACTRHELAERVGVFSKYIAKALTAAVAARAPAPRRTGRPRHRALLAAGGRGGCVTAGQATAGHQWTQARIRRLAALTLTKPQLDAWRLHVDGCGYSRVAQILGISRDSARDRINGANARLRHHIEHDTPQLRQALLDADANER